MTADPADHTSDHETAPDSDTAAHEDFLVALRKALRPEVLARAGDQLAEVVTAVAEHAKKGSLTLKLDLKPLGNGHEAVEVVATTKTSVPEPTPAVRFLWPTTRGRLETSDPRQQELPGIHAVTDTKDRP